MHAPLPADCSAPPGTHAMAHLSPVAHFLLNPFPTAGIGADTPAWCSSALGEKQNLLRAS